MKAEVKYEEVIVERCIALTATQSSSNRQSLDNVHPSGGNQRALMSSLRRNLVQKALW